MQRNSAGDHGTTTQIARMVVALHRCCNDHGGGGGCGRRRAAPINWEVALGAAALFGSVYCLLALTANRELYSNSHRISMAAKQQIKALQEGLGAIRDVLLDGNQVTYLETYRQADWPQRQLQAKNQFLSAFPRYAVEALGLVAISVLGGLLVVKQGSGGSVIPLLGALPGAQRLLPALQQVYGSCQM